MSKILEKVLTPLVKDLELQYIPKIKSIKVN